MNNKTPSQLFTSLNLKYGREWLEWELEVIENTLKPKDVKEYDLYCALQVNATNPDLFEDWDLFNHVAVAFNDRRCSFEWLDTVNVGELTFAIQQIRLIKPNRPFGPEVIAYATAIAQNEGLVYYPWLQLITNKENTTLANEVQQVYNTGKLKNTILQDLTDEQARCPLHTQLHNLLRIENYLNDKHN